ncbi:MULTISPECIES: bifunctional biotin--[acetyl-CoA-carboxylase] ligase/biotin operon repressor BirA [unclassified Streptococcus]|uniref:bifunctional biotin--[acetyl-CoA-carboxylase] ligase/biotin operon repressor BirA n=1 Tax=unclassified Streptococcus TaxID=2608887 RepID=UPI0010722B87|nr:MULTISPECIES: bifunctional biotin--[acetyl-CoA-carboxylase] ligase/biotin operon repressor BirA [unclassified Streptococcus]MBF0786789.1 bifunctional biotin--[acetyl-CoA-carboxylase] ligase/biotin operon repressor BirA [Streptococcus sp. 19428wC2_LYSM12]MCQ9211028.1 bifunctional biotin--[acetyl-CoA-carboxylase] ligase/biotin operon repressor BirA [Streptococcus sp. B01]MCQ9214303.1 bifunctional biotin--[acetyl-CoA-carboxylase] ligase/biotin operon repressor BirA [Streptococcus sp. O1]TFV0633
MKTYEKIYKLLWNTKDSISEEELAQTLGISRTSVWKGIKSLEKQGLIIKVSSNRSYRLEQGDLLLPEEIAQNLGIPVHFMTDSTSTQLDAKRGIERQDKSPALYLAPTQAQAQGRFGRSFFTAKTGGIYMTLRLRPEASFKDLKPYTLLVAAAIVKAIEQLTDIQVNIKWVNDIYQNGKKIAGILTESISSVEAQVVTDIIIGVGLNFHLLDLPAELSKTASSLFTDTPSITRNQLITKIWHIFFTTSEEELLTLYKKKSLVLGKQVTFSQQNQHYCGLATAITDTGTLQVQLEDGSLKMLSSGDISLASWSDSPRPE